nr:MBL fold metallo-hydrolase [Paenibacillus allorhizosphaerae]
MKRIQQRLFFLLLVLVALAMAAGCGSTTPAASAGSSSAGVKPDTAAMSAEKRKQAVFATKPYKDLLTVRYLDLQNSEASGDSIVIQSPDGQTMLVDAGIPAVGPQVVGYLTQLGIDKLDIAVNTHPHPDHIGGFESVFRSKQVDQFYLGNLRPVEWSSYTSALAAANAKQVKQTFLEEGMEFQLGKEVHVKVMNPKKGELPGSIKKFELDEVNNPSIVLLLTYKNTRFLFTGDIHREREVELVEKYGDQLRADFMDAPHHGISTSSSQSFLQTVAPKVSVISYNKFNNFKQLLNYQKNSKSTYVTALHGNVLITSDGKELNVITEKDYPAKSGTESSSK